MDGMYSWKSVSDIAAATLGEFQSLDQLAQEDKYVNSETWHVRKNSGSSSGSMLKELIGATDTSKTENNDAMTKTTPPPSAVAIGKSASKDDESSSFSSDYPPYSGDGSDSGREWSLLDLPMTPWQQAQQREEEEKANVDREEEITPRGSETNTTDTMKKIDKKIGVPVVMPVLSVVKALMETGELPEDDYSKSKKFDDGYESRSDSSEGGVLAKHPWTQDVDTDSDEDGEDHEFVRLMKTKQSDNSQLDIPLGGEEEPENDKVEPPLTDLEIDNRSSSPVTSEISTTRNRKPVWFDALDEDAKEFEGSPSTTIHTNSPGSSPLYQTYNENGGASISNTPRPQPRNDSNTPATPKWLKSLTKNPRIISLYQNIESQAKVQLSRASVVVQRKMGETATATSAPLSSQHSPWSRDDGEQYETTSASFQGDELAELDRIRQLQNQGLKGIIIEFLLRNERFIFIGVTLFVASFVYFYTRKRALS
mmetsp:Transcript_30027/g.36606  ORF Transcript_30027/g.36606 Transcript_30027/m.36606 type:complete len:481 (-) Transcript_30027:133-1575(-)